MFGELDSMIDELQAYSTQIARARERGDISVIPRLANICAKIALDVEAKAKRIEDEAVRDSFPDDL